MLGLCCSVVFFLVVESISYSVVVVCGLLIAVILSLQSTGTREVRLQ